MLVRVGRLTIGATILDVATIPTREQLDTSHIGFGQEAIGTKVAILFVLHTLEHVHETMSTKTIDASPVAFVAIAILALDTKGSSAKVTTYVLVTGMAVDQQKSRR